MDNYVLDKKFLSEIKDRFETEEKKFHEAKRIYLGSYLSSCSNETLKTFNSQIKGLYDDIDESYRKIYKWLSEYSSDVSKIDSSLAYGTNVVNDSNLRAYLKSFVSNINSNPRQIDKKINIVSSVVKEKYSAMNNVDEGLKKTGNLFKNVGAKVAGTVGTMLVSFTEGLLTYGEKLEDTATIMADRAVNYVFYKTGLISEQARNTGAKELREQMKDKGSFWKSEYDDFYNSKIGKAVKNNTIRYNEVRQVSEGLGEIAGTAAMAGGAGVGKAATKTVSKVTSKVGSKTIAKVSSKYGSAAAKKLVVKSAAAKTVGKKAAKTFCATALTTYGSHVKNAWKDGATYSEGIKAGKEKTVVSTAVSLAFGKLFPEFDNAAADFVMKRSKEASSGLVGSATDTVVKAGYKDTYTDFDGKKRKFTKDDSMVDKLGHVYMDDGGLKGTAKTMVVSSVKGGTKSVASSVASSN